VKYGVALPQLGRYIESAQAEGALAWYPRFEQAKVIAQVVGGKVVNAEKFLQLLGRGVSFAEAARRAPARNVRLRFDLIPKGWALLRP
jgi:hypothetical protein